MISQNLVCYLVQTCSRYLHGWVVANKIKNENDVCVIIAFCKGFLTVTIRLGENCVGHKYGNSILRGFFDSTLFFFFPFFFLGHQAGRAHRLGPITLIKPRVDFFFPTFYLRLEGRRFKPLPSLLISEKIPSKLQNQ